MQIFSFQRKGLSLEKFEVEVGFLPGVPRIHLSGMPDVTAKESLVRFRSALLSSEFELPNREQLIINLKPAFVRKQSCGIDLGIALAYLIASGQLADTSFAQYLEEKKISKIYVYGELGLDGAVFTPEDFEFFDSKVLDDESLVVTGSVSSFVKSGIANEKIFELNQLGDLRQTVTLEADYPIEDFRLKLQPPEIPHFVFCSVAAKLMAIVAAGEHSLMLAGPAGSGKTTFMDSLYSCLRAPTQAEFREIVKVSKIFGLTPTWRPFVAPHHSATELSIIGGGLPPEPGEITRAHGGILYMDEFLEFSPGVKECLREPMEKKEILISRKGVSQKFPARLLLLASTNLCPCGDLTLGKKRKPCRYSITRCRSYSQRLHGPVLDRFELFALSSDWSREKNVTIPEIKLEVEKAIAFAKKERDQDVPNSKLTVREVEKSIEPFALHHTLPQIPISLRRKSALLRVARTIADIEGSVLVKSHHLESSRSLTLTPFADLKKLWN